MPSVEHDKRAVAAAALARGATQAEAAVAAGVHRRTVCRWSKEPPFQADVAEVRRDLLRRCAGKLAGELHRAVDVLVNLLDKPEVPQAITARLGVAKSIVQLALAVQDHAELSERIARLEKLLEHHDAR